jgi:hypothetical protein
MLATLWATPGCGGPAGYLDGDSAEAGTSRDRPSSDGPADGGHRASGHDAALADHPAHEANAPSSGGSRFVFAVTGDCRPTIPDDVPGYPTKIAQTIFDDIAALHPAADFVVGTGDYQFSDPLTGLASDQIALYMGARKAFAGPFYPAMGNHECDGLTDSNCGPGTSTGNTVPYTAFMSDMLGPIGQKEPYYVIHTAASDASWTLKLVYIAANAWTSEQATWLASAMAEATTYTFVVRHEPAAANTAPGVTPSEAIMAKYPYTLALVGHTHTFEKSGPREVIVGNGGAPLSSSVNYGFGLVTQRKDGTVLVEMIDYESGATSDAFALTPTGGSAPL